MVVVVPTFAEGEQSDPETVATLVIVVESLVADDMSHRIDTKGDVVDENGAEEESPHDHLHATRAQSWVVGIQGRACGI